MDQKLRRFIEQNSLDSKAAILYLSNLESLDICYSGLEQYDFKRIISKMPKLKKIFALGCNLRSIPADFVRLSRLEELHVSVLDGQSLGNLLLQAPNIKILTIRNCEILVTPTYFANLRYLEVLDISHCHFTAEVFTAMAQAPRIRIINAGFCRNLSPIPEDFPQLKYLEELSICYSNLTGADLSKIATGAKLKKIVASHCKKLSPIPVNFQRLESLEEINLSESSITGMDLKILAAAIPNVKELRAENCLQLNTIGQKLHQIKLNFARLVLTGSAIDLKSLLVLITAVPESKLLQNISLSNPQLIAMMEQASLWAKMILVAAFPEQLSGEFLHNSNFAPAYKLVLTSKLIGSNDAQNLFISCLRPGESDADYQIFMQNGKAFESLAAKYWNYFTGALPRVPFICVLHYLDRYDAFAKRLASPIKSGDLLAAYTVFAPLYWQYMRFEEIKKFKSQGQPQLIQYYRCKRENLYTKAKAINRQLLANNSKQLDNNQDNLYMYRQIFTELFKAEPSQITISERLKRVFCLC